MAAAIELRVRGRKGRRAKGGQGRENMREKGEGGRGEGVKF